MKRLLITLLCAAALFAQEQVSRVVQLRHIPPGSVQVVLSILSAGKVNFQSDPNVNYIAMRGPLEFVDAMEAAIKKLDVPPPAIRNIELTFNILAAGTQAGTDTVPPDLAGVVQQLGKVFGLKSFRLLETAVLRGREGRPMESSGVLPVPVKVDSSPRYFLRFQKVSTSPAEKGLLIRIDGLDFNVSIPVLKVGGQGLDYLSAGIKTDVDVREGQRVVVGKSSFDTTGQSVFLVVSAKVLD